MASINRFDRPVQKDWSWTTFIPQLPQLDFEQMDLLLAGQQAKVDNLEATKSLVPNALQTDEDLKLQKDYKDLVNSGSQQVSDAYLKSPSAGNLAYKNYVNLVKKAWQPGGQADILNKRYQGYYEGKKAIDDYYKDETNPAFKQFAYDQLQQQVQAGPKYNPATGEYQVVNTPELFKNPDLRKKINEMVHEIDDSGDTQFLGDTNKDWWIQKIKTSGKAEDKIKYATQALMAQPEFANQLKVEQWYQNRGGQGQVAVENFKNQQNQQLGNLTQQAKDAESGKNTKEFQQLLVENGYDVSPDGVYGDKTKQAAKDFLSKQNQTLQENLANPNIESIVGRKNLENSYIDYAKGFANKKVEKDLVFNKQKEVLLKSSNDRARTNALLQLNDRLAPPVDPDILTTPAPATNLTSAFDLLKETKQNKEKFVSTATQALTQNPNSIFNGWTMSNVGEAQRLFNEVPTTLNGKQLTEAERLSLFYSGLKENSSFDFTPQQVKDVYNGIKTNTGVNETFEQMASFDHAQKMLEDNTTQISQTYISTPEGKDRIKSLGAFRKSGESDTDLMSRALSNPEQFKPNVSPGMAPGYVPKGGYQNVAESFKAGMQSDVKKLQQQGVDFKTENAWAIHAGDKDKFLKPVYDNIVNAINSQVEGSFSSEGLSGLVFKDMKGEVKDVKPKFTYGNVTVGADGKPVFRATGMTPGKKPEMVSTEIALNDGNPIAIKLERELRKELAQNAATGNWADVESVAKVINTFDSKNIVSAAQEQSTNLKGVVPQALVMKDSDGNLTTTAKQGIKTRKIADKNYGGVNYETYVGQDLTGNKIFFNVADRVDESGNPTGQKVVIPLRNGKNYSSDVNEINVFNLAGEIISQTPVEREVKKIPNGVIQSITNFE